MYYVILNVLEIIFVSVFIVNIYSCIKGRGVYKVLFDLRKFLKDINGIKYCLKLDIKKFFLSIFNEILKEMLRKKFKDKDLLYFLDNIIDFYEGVLLGNYIS